MGHWMVWFGEKKLKETETATDRWSLKIAAPKSQKNRKCQLTALAKSMKNNLETVKIAAKIFKGFC